MLVLDWIDPKLSEIDGIISGMNYALNYEKIKLNGFLFYLKNMHLFFFSFNFYFGLSACMHYADALPIWHNSLDRTLG